MQEEKTITSGSISSSSSVSSFVSFSTEKTKNMFILKNNHFWFHVFFLITIQSVDLVVFVSSSSMNNQFEACRPRNCGNGKNISYPFWIHGIHQDYCGYPKFRVTCKNHEPVLHSSGNDYIIRDIFYEKQSFRVANSIGKDSEFDSCPSPIQNATFNENDLQISTASIPPFKVGPNVVNLSFFYNCTIDTTYSLYNPGPNYVFNPKSCTLTDSQHSSFIMASVPVYSDFYWNSKCKTFVLVPVEVSRGIELGTGEPIFIDPSKYTPLLEDGFLLEWNTKTDCNQCKKSGGYCGVDKEELVCFCVDRPYPNRCNVDEPDDSKNIKEKKKRKKKKIAIGVGAGIGGFILACLCCCLFFYLRRRKNRRSISLNLISQNISPDSFLKPDPENQTPIFSYKELEEATNNFDSNRELGDGGFGTVYRGELQDGRVVAVKRLYENNFKRVEQFMNEVNILSLLRHENLVTLYGCTSRHSRELLLVYEYIPNGTVADHIHGKLAKAGLATWPIRINIAIETAGALKYLHASDIIHRDVKTNNILLDKSFHVKVADFGLSRLFPNDKTHVSTAPQGTPGYVDPEYYQCYQLTDKSDVYSFGVVLIELISSKPAVDISRHRHDINLANMAINKIQNHSLSELVDPRLGFESDSHARRLITLVAELAFRCLQQDRDMRPSMVEVLDILKGIVGEEDNVVKAVEVIDISADHDVVGLLKNDTAPFSPISVTDKWGSVASTPNTSS